MPAAIDPATRADIIYYSALGYTQQEISDAVGVSRNTIRKYRRAARDAVADADDPRRTLAEILLNEYNWDRTDGPVLSFGDHAM